MARAVWEPVKVQFCDKVGRQVALEVLHIFPAEILPDQPPRIASHRCSLGLLCNQLDQPACRWAGTNPAYDPFS
jgi:hypothetical protein